MLAYYLQKNYDSARVHLLQVTVKLLEVTTFCTRWLYIPCAHQEIQMLVTVLQRLNHIM